MDLEVIEETCKGLYFGFEAFNVQHTRTYSDGVLTAKGSSILANLVVLFLDLVKVS